MALEWQGAANAMAGTTGLEAVGALNVLAGTTGLELAGVLNRLAGTTGLGVAAAMNILSSTTGLELVGAAGAFSPSAPIATFDVDTESWSNGNAGTTLTRSTTNPQAGAGCLNASRSFAATFDQVWTRSNTGLALSKRYLRCYVRVESGALGTWTARIGYNLTAAAGATLLLPVATSITADGNWKPIFCDITALAHNPSEVDRVVVQIQRGSGQAVTTVNVGVDTVTQGATSS